jgi:hypothetical protein
LEHAPYERLKWRVLREFHALPTEERVQKMTDRDYLWCLLQMTLDEEEELERLCPTCRMEALEERCPVCGMPAGSGEGMQNAAFDEERYLRLKEGKSG